MISALPFDDFLAATLRQQPPLADTLSLGELTLSWPAAGMLRLTPKALPDGTDRVLLSAGVHGNETAPIEVLAGIVADLLAGRLTLAVDLQVLFGNPDAMRVGERYLDYDMNRLFNGAHQQQPLARESARAAQLEAQADAFFSSSPTGARRLHYDLHTAIRGSVYEKFAIYPFLHEREHNQEQLEWLTACGVNTVLLHSAPANTFSYYTSRHHLADSFTLELGKARPFGENDLTRFAGIDVALRALVSGQQPPRSADDSLHLFRAKYNLIKASDAFRLHLADDVENFTTLPDGFLIAEDGDTRYVASGGEERILFPNPKVQNGLRAGIVVEPVTL
ncbi:succinylglutamate desuccinylase [Crenobacter sp. SG2303]|uniref:Succinylglutamate desuccinylase n=1 Tax=Crenobacter oryzisoli TaxID=3056844 RepID=A0ABT7XKE2_9NEIS|nr:succinylglutamate desuccinylase [Crenobacter sp. SG2303]MDN0074262.1 succinylglutamate desuccinylase [Crenobacter sp. SG2303]